MKFKVEYSPGFFNDFSQAVDWYNEIQPKLGDRLYNNVRKQTKKLSTSALYFAVKYDDIRCMCIKQFPYVVHYRLNEQTKTVRVEAMFHTSRDPKIWNERDVD
jgi:hypothetical protein